MWCILSQIGMKKPALPDHLPACRKVGHSVRLTFIRAIRHVLKCENAEAERVFDADLKAGKIVEAWEREGVKIFKTSE